MAAYRQNLGRWGENLAADYLVQRGYTILERNLRTPYGEIDLIARQVIPDPDPGQAGAGGRAVTVFVEVKTRASAALGYPEEAVTQRKRAHLLAAAQAYQQDHPDPDGEWRVDVIAIQRARPGRPPIITHFEDAFH